MYYLSFRGLIGMSVDRYHALRCGTVFNPLLPTSVRYLLTNFFIPFHHNKQAAFCFRLQCLLTSYSSSYGSILQSPQWVSADQEMPQPILPQRGELRAFSWKNLYPQPTSYCSIILQEDATNMRFNFKGEMIWMNFRHESAKIFICCCCLLLLWL